MSRKLILTVAVLLMGAGIVLTFDGVRLKLKAALAQHLMARAWVQAQTGDSEAKPWPWADIHPAAKLTFLRLDQSYIVLSGTSGEALAFGPGLTQLPGGATLIAGHRDSHFRVLKDIEIGDEIILTPAQGPARHYRITQTAVTGPEAQLPAEPVLALVTCWPFDALSEASERLVVMAVLLNANAG